MAKMSKVFELSDGVKKVILEADQRIDIDDIAVLLSAKLARLGIKNRVGFAEMMLEARHPDEDIEHITLRDPLK